MPRGLTPQQQAFAREVFAELIERFPNQTEIANRLGIDQSRVSAIRTTGKTSMQVLMAAAKLAERPRMEIARITGMLGHLESVMEHIGGAWEGITGTQSGANLPIGTFLLKLDRLPGLREWIEENPSKLSVLQIARGIVTYEAVKPRSREDGRPFEGWGAFFDDALAGRLDGQIKKGDQGAAEALEARQLTKKNRDRLRIASKKSK